MEWVPQLEWWDAGLQAVQEGQAGQAGGGVALCIQERFDCTALTVRDDVVDSLWVRISRMKNKGDATAGIYHQSRSWGISTNELFYGQLGEKFLDW